MFPSTTFKLFYRFVLLLALVPLSGCGLSQEQTTARTATAQTAVAALWMSTPTSTATLTPTATLTVTPSPTHTRVPTSTPAPASTATTVPHPRYTIKDATFSFVAPEGWEKVDDTRRIIFYGPAIDGMQLILSFSLDQYAMLGTPLDADEIGIALFSAHVQDTLAEMTKNVTNISEDFGENAEGEAYFRWVMQHSANGKELHQAFYIFGTGKWFLTVMYGRPKAAGAEYDAIIDEAMQTLFFEE